MNKLQSWQFPIYFSLCYIQKKLSILVWLFHHLLWKKEFHQSDHILTIIYKYLLTSFHFIITMTNHSSSNLDYASDLRNFELFYIIKGLDIQESWKLSKEALWIEEIKNCIVYAWNLGVLKDFASMFMRLLICSFLLQ